MTDFESGKGDKASYLEWALLIDPETVGQMRFSPAVEDTNWLIRLAKPEPQHRYEYMHQDVSGGPPVICSMWVLVNSAQLLYGKSTGQIFLKMNLKWWNERRTQRPWNFKFRLSSIDSLTLAEPDIGGFIIDCQCTVPPNDLWETTVPLNRTGLQSFNAVEFGRLLPPVKLFGDHGPVCA